MEMRSRLINFWQKQCLGVSKMDRNKLKWAERTDDVYGRLHNLIQKEEKLLPHSPMCHKSLKAYIWHKRSGCFPKFPRVSEFDRGNNGIDIRKEHIYISLLLFTVKKRSLLSMCCVHIFGLLAKAIYDHFYQLRMPIVFKCPVSCISCSYLADPSLVENNWMKNCCLEWWIVPLNSFNREYLLQILKPFKVFKGMSLFQGISIMRSWFFVYRNAR